MDNTKASEQDSEKTAKIKSPREVMPAGQPKGMRGALHTFGEVTALVEHAYEASHGEVTEHTESLEKLQKLSADESIEALARYLRMLHAHSAAITEEKRRLSAIQEQIELRRDWAEGKVRAILEQVGERKILAGPFQVSLRKSPPYVFADPSRLNVDALPPELVRVIPEQRELDKGKAKQALQKAMDLASKKEGSDPGPFRALLALGLDLRRGEDQVRIE